MQYRPILFCENKIKENRIPRLIIYTFAHERSIPGNLNQQFDTFLYIILMAKILHRPNWKQETFKGAI